MTIRTRAQALFLATALLVASGLVGVYAQQPAPANAPPPPLTQAMPVDPAITHGQLPNGLHYYVRANKQAGEARRAPARRQRRIDPRRRRPARARALRRAHGLQRHGALSRSRTSSSFIESLGMRFGARRQRVHELRRDRLHADRCRPTSPTIDRQVAAHPRGLGARRDVRSGRNRQGTRRRHGGMAPAAAAPTRACSDKLFPILLKGSRYADRLPIGKTEIIQNFKPERLKKFYTDWYRPDLMAVVAVGDFDKTAVETLDQDALRVDAGRRRRRGRGRRYDVPDHAGHACSRSPPTRRRPTTTVEVDNAAAGARPRARSAATAQKIVDRLFASMLSARFAELAQKPDAPFLGAGAGRGRFVARTQGRTRRSARW